MEMRNKQNWYKTSWWGSKFHRNKIRSVGTCQREWHCAYDRSYAGLCLKKHFCKALSLLPAHGFVSTSWSYPLFNLKLPTAFFQRPPPPLVIVPKSDCSILISPMSNKRFSNVPRLVKHGNTHDSRNEIRMRALNQSWQSTHQANIFRLGSSQLFISYIEAEFKDGAY